MGMERDHFMQEIGLSINASIVRHREAFEDRRRQRANPSNPENHPAFKISRDQSDPKSRWVNGTPEYSFGIGGLRKLFPAARFIHLVRHPDLVVPSMLNFDRVDGNRLVETEEEGYERWMAYVRASVIAEDALGAETVCRVFHQDLVKEPEAAMQQILDFLGEPAAAACLEPLQKRINSSNVAAEERKREQATESAKVAEAHDLWKLLRGTTVRAEALAEAAAAMEEQFENRVAYVYELDAHCAQTRQAHRKLQHEFDERTRWALRLKQEGETKDKRILEMQNELADRTKWALVLKDEVAHRDGLIRQLQKEFADRERWAQELESESARKDELILKLQGQLSEGVEPPSGV